MATLLCIIPTHLGLLYSYPSRLGGAHFDKCISDDIGRCHSRNGPIKRSGVYIGLVDNRSNHVSPSAPDKPQSGHSVESKFVY